MVIYAIREYSFYKRKSLFSYEPIPVSEHPTEIKPGVFKVGNDEFKSNHYITYSLKPKGVIYDPQGTYPGVTATLTEDLPGNVKFKPRVVKGCKLMMEKHGGYLEFKNSKSGELYRRAMNSWTAEITEYPEV